MNEAGRHLHALAGRLADVYVVHTAPRAIMLAGSAAEDKADFLSDLDLILFHESVPAVEACAAARAELGVERFDVMFPHSETSYGEQYEVGGVTCQAAHLTLDAVRADLAIVASGEGARSPLQKVAGGMLGGVPLVGHDVVAELRAASAYTDELQRATIAAHWTFFPLWFIEPQLARRDATVWHYEILVESAYNLLGVLAALNRLHYTTFQLKRMHALIARMQIAPERLADRIEALFAGDVDAAVADLERLIGETQALVQTHLPGVEVPIRRALGTRLQPWAV